MKHLLLALTVAFMACNGQDEAPFDCSQVIPKLKGVSVGFMLEGEFFSDAPNSISIEKVVNPKDWKDNEYFTGKGFSKDKKDVLKFQEKDSCHLKKIYFEYLNKKK